MPIAFISHSSKNKPLVEELFKRIGADNCVVDKYTFESGAKTISQIFENLQRTDLFVLIISGAALDSDWVKYEVSTSKDRLDLNQIKRFLPINIDKNINHQDPRIPLWIRQNYDLKHVTNLNIIVSKIKRYLREITIEANPRIAERLQNFVGRNALIEEFEDRYINIENVKPTAIIVSGLEGVGRRTFLKKALEKNKLFASTYEPALINLEASDGIDDLILKLDEGYSSYNRDFVSNLRAMDITEKVELVRKTILEYLNSHEVIFFIDNGCLILRTGEFNDWFLTLASIPEFSNRVSFCLISRFRPTKSELASIKFRYIALQVPPLSDADKEKLFVRVMNSKDISFDNSKLETVLSFLNGFPDQIFYTADLIQEHGIDTVLKMREYITDFYDNKLINQFRNIIDTERTRDIVVVLAHFGTISNDYLVDIFYDKPDLNESLEQLFTLGAYELVGLSKEFLKVNYALSDYINRNRVQMSPSIELRIRHKITTIVNDNFDIPTYSDILNTLKQGLVNGLDIPDHLLLPSLVLKSISSLYDRKDYKYVVSLGNKILENSAHIDKQVKREIHYFLCLAYARLKDERFEIEVKYFDFPETEFLYGLYHRIRKNYRKAKEHLKIAVKSMGYKIQARSELVLTLFALEQYAEAESLALDNYNKYKNNPFYIQAYFKCLIHRQTATIQEQKLLVELIERMGSNLHPKAPDMKLVMEAQYDYYVNGDSESAERKLRISIKSGSNRQNALSILYKIYQNERNYQGMDQLSTINFGEDFVDDDD
jgi:hypothetical protein